jgi:hypothetical protein
VVELLGVHVEQVGVALQLVDIDYLVEILESGDLGVFSKGLYEGEFVKVACCDDTGVLVLGEDFLC